MNIEQKAKAYDEALEVMRQWVAPCHTKEQLDTMKKSVFPELRESEDERIRKALVDYFVHFNPEDKWDEEFSFKDVLAYLEKQKGDKDELVYRLNGLMQDYIKEGKDDEEKEHRLKCYQLFWDALEDANFFEQKGQKPVDYDHEMWKNCEANFEGGKKEVIKHPEKYGLQNPAEWSEKDEKMLADTLNSLKRYQLSMPNYQVELQMRWLKSLRPSWKPSEEQMDALKELIDDANRAGWVTPGATELYEQLKKLM